jgi:predicted methyltransferase
MNASAQNVPAHVAAAVNDKSRPAADTMRDAARKPAESVAFFGVKPGDKIADFIAGGRYFTRIFSKVVGPHPEGRQRAGPSATRAKNSRSARNLHARHYSFVRLRMSSFGFEWRITARCVSSRHRPRPQYRRA